MPLYDRTALPLEVRSLLSQVTLASVAGSTPVTSQLGLHVTVTGRLTPTSLGVEANQLKFVRFADHLVLTHSSPTMIMPEGRNIMTAPGDTCLMTSDGSGNVTVSNYVRARKPSSTPHRALLLGDSITEQNAFMDNVSAWPTKYYTYQTEGYFVQTNRFLGGPFYLDPKMCQGIGGEISTQWLARWDTDILPNYDRFDIAFLVGPTNDLVVGHTLAAMNVAIANMKTMIDRFRSLGKWVVLMPILPRGDIDSVSRALREYYNHAMESWARSEPELLIYDDPSADLVNQSSNTGATLLNLYQEGVVGVHPSAAGAYKIGQRLSANRRLVSLAQDSLSRAKTVTNVYDATNNVLGNRLANPGILTLTGGTAFTPVTGVLAANWLGLRQNGTFPAGSAVCSVEAPISVEGYDNPPGGKQVCTISIPAANTTFECVRFVASYTGFVPGDVIAARCTVDVVNPVRWRNVRLIMSEQDGSNFPDSAIDGQDYQSRILPAVSMLKQVYRTPDWIVQGAGHNFAVLIEFFFDASAGPASAVCKFYGVELFRVQ